MTIKAFNSIAVLAFVLKDLDSEMEKRRFDAILIVGDTTYGNPELYYVLGAHLARGGMYLKKLREEPLLIASNIDIESAKKSRVKDIQTYLDYGYERLIQTYGRQKGSILLYDKIFEAHKANGRIGLYGKIEAARAIGMADSLRRLGHRVVGEKPPTLLDVLRETKDSFELEKIREVCSKAEKIIINTMQFVKGCRILDGYLYEDDSRLNVGRVKKLIRRLLAEEGLVATEDIIFACGARSSDPHYTGEDSDYIKADEPIVFDLFPQQAGGYWADITRTYVVGRPSRELKSIHEAVLEAQLKALDLLHEGVDGKYVMNQVCDSFENRGYKTIRSALRGDRSAESEGFIHSLGHGLGLTIGEEPYLSLLTGGILKEGHVVTVEPGLYIPGLGGVRIEDDVVISKKGVQNFIKLDKDLTL